MAVVHIGNKHQVTLPKEIVRRSHLAPGDPLEVVYEDDRIILRPQIHVPREQAYFWTKEWQAAEREAEEDITKGRTRGPFRSVAVFKKSLRRP